MKTENWVAIWGNAPSVANTRPASYAKDITLRYTLRSSLNGSAVRVHFTNFCGRQAITIAKAYVARVTDGHTIDKSTMKQVLFDGEPSVTIDKGAIRCSDSVEFPVAAGDELAISFYLEDYTDMRTCVHIQGPLVKNWFSLGDSAAAESLTAENTRTTSSYYFLNTVDVLNNDGAKATVLFGDSITAEDWPDYVTLKLLEQHQSTRAVIRRATSGSRILGQYDCADYAHYGLQGKTRFESEIAVAGADSVVILHGINDIIHPDGINPYRPMSNMPTADDIIGGYRWYMEIARKHHLKVYFATLLPIKNWRTYAPFREDVRKPVNDWIRHNTEADGLVDFDRALRDENEPEMFAASYDSGDHLHPSTAGYEQMAACYYHYMLERR